MKWHTTFLSILIIISMFIVLSCKPAVYYGDKRLPGHPRLMLLKGEEKDLLRSVLSDPVWKSIHGLILDECDSIITRPLPERIQTGRRLLAVSRECLRRIYFLSYAYRMTGEARYLERAEKEMLAVASFSDWNPSHFLDVAEMTAAMAIGYDWLNKYLDRDSREIIKNAIITKGLEPSLPEEGNWWITAIHNWNQVCHTGMSLGALAVFEDEPELARKVIDRAIANIPLPMKEYSPDGAYPEGYSYWGYGTEFNVLFLSAIEKAFDTDSGLKSIPGFMQTAGFLKNMTGPTGKPFNFSDCGPGSSLNPAMFWFARQLNDNTLLQNETGYLDDPRPLRSERFLPSLLIWGAGIDTKNTGNSNELIWVGHGKTPLALMRTSQTDPDAIFVGMRGGTPSSNHSHMDIGSFVMDALGVRWAMDFGAQDYYSLESANVNLWSMDQNSQRWEVFRYNNMAHNTLTINGELQKVAGYADISAFTADPDFLSATTDITALYVPSVSSVNRGIAIRDKKYVVIRDEITTGEKAARIRWNMLTPASVQVSDSNHAGLTQNGKKLRLVILEPPDAGLKTWSTDPPHSYDAPNPGTIFTGFELTVPAGTSASIVVALVPGDEKIPDKADIPRLAEWK